MLKYILGLLLVSQVATAAIPGYGTPLQFKALAAEAITSPPKATYTKRENAFEVTATNKWLELIENGGAVKAVQVPLGKYLKAYLANNTNTYGLDEVIEDAIMAYPGIVGTYTVAYDKGTQEYTISATGLTTLSIPCKTGAHGADNADDHICSLIGLGDAADQTGALTYTGSAVSGAKTITVRNANTTTIDSQEATGYVGTTAAIGDTVTVNMGGVLPGFSNLEVGTRYVTSASSGVVVKQENAVVGSKEAGIAVTAKNMLFNFLAKIVVSPESWLTTPTSYDAGIEVLNGDMHCNSAGYCVRIFMRDPVGVSPYYYFQYSSNGGISWSTSASTIARSQGFYENYNGNYYEKPRIVLDENGYGVAIFGVYASANMRVYRSNTNDYGVTWSAATSIVASEYDVVYPAGLAIRENKAVALVTNSSSNDTRIFISNNTGSGYSTWSSAVSLTYDYRSTSPSWVGIQYFPAETGINKYRIVTLGEKFASTYSMAYHTFKGDGSSETYGYVADDSSGNEGVPIAVGIDQSGTKNIIVVLQGYIGGSFSKIRQAESNEGYNSGTLTWNNHGLQDINSGGSAVDRFNGYSSANDTSMIWNLNNRMVVYGNYAYAIVQTNANPGSLPAATLFSTTNLTGGTWTSTNVGLQAGAVQEASLCHIPSVNGLALVYKYNTAGLANNLINGQVQARFGEILTNGSIAWQDHIQIDGGKVMTGFAGFVQPACYRDGVAVTYEQLLSTYDGLKGQALK